MEDWQVREKWQCPIHVHMYTIDRPWLSYPLNCSDTTTGVTAIHTFIKSQNPCLLFLVIFQKEKCPPKLSSVKLSSREQKPCVLRFHLWDLLDYTFLTPSFLPLHGHRLIKALGFGWEGQRHNGNLEESGWAARLNSPLSTIKADSIFWRSTFLVHSKGLGKHPWLLISSKKISQGTWGKGMWSRFSLNAHGGPRQEWKWRTTCLNTRVFRGNFANS